MLCKALGRTVFHRGNQGSNQGENNEQIARINGLVDGKIYRKPWFLPSNMGLSCKFSLKPIHSKKCRKRRIVVSGFGFRGYERVLDVITAKNYGKTCYDYVN
jgi:hypothetical protein